MQANHLVVSDPPHGEVDTEAAAELLGLSAAEARMKANFVAPEIWYASRQEDRAAEAAEALDAAGLRVVLAEGADLAAIPWSVPARSFAFDESAMVIGLDDGAAVLPYDSEAFAVVCTPPPGFEDETARPKAQTGSARTTLGRRSTSALVARMVGSSSAERLATAEAVERLTHLDLYWDEDGVACRVAIAPGVTDFDGLGYVKRPRGRENLESCVSECERRFGRLRLDRRHENVRPRRRVSIAGGESPAEGRRLFSFGTLDLRRLLESIAPELTDVTQYELGSRLAYLMSRAAAEAS